MADPVVAQVQDMRDIAFAMGAVKLQSFGIKAEHWFAAMTKKINLMKEIDDELANNLKAQAKASYSDARNALITLVIFVLVILIAVVVVLSVVIRGVLLQLGADPSTVVEVVEKIAGGALAVEFNTKSKEATGVFAAMQRMVENLRTIMHDLNQTALALTSSAEEMDITSTEMSTGLN